MALTRGILEGQVSGECSNREHNFSKIHTDLVWEEVEFAFKTALVKGRILRQAQGGAYC